LEHFFNVYVRSNVEKVSGICSQQFIKSKFFKHIHMGKIEKFKHKKCANKKKYLGICKRRGLVRNALKECVFDMCAGMSKKMENKIINNNKKEYKKATKKRVTRIQCSMFADPHVHGFNNRNYDAQTVGDWVLYKGDNLSAHYRGKRMSRVWVGAVKFGVRIYNDRIYSNDLQFKTLIINGHVKQLNAGVTNLSGRGTVIKAGNKLTFNTNDGEAVDFISFGTFMNVYVRSNVEKVTGLCSQQFIRSHFFNHYHIGKIVKIKNIKCHNKKKFHKECKHRGLKKKALKQCVFDFCAGIEKKIEEKIISINKEEKKLKKNSYKTCFKNNMFFNCRPTCTWI